jgi:ABC-2 type transport system ATP-binding protein
MSVAIECTNLSKNYGKTTALDNINMKLEENKIYGFLGRNGAGKTTFLNILSAQVFNSSGEIKVFEETAFENDKILSSICFIKDRLLYMSNFKVKDIFSISKDFFQNWDEDFKDKLVEAFKLDSNKKYKALSKGMGAAVGIIIGLAARAPLTIFDESYSGLDACSKTIIL